MIIFYTVKQIVSPFVIYFHLQLKGFIRHVTFVSQWCAGYKSYMGGSSWMFNIRRSEHKEDTEEVEIKYFTHSTIRQKCQPHYRLAIQWLHIVHCNWYVYLPVAISGWFLHSKLWLRYSIHFSLYFNIAHPMKTQKVAFEIFLIFIFCRTISEQFIF